MYRCSLYYSILCDTPCTYPIVLFFTIGALRVTIRRDAVALTAGQSYNLTCTVTLDGITGSPTIEWLDPNNNPVLNRSSVTVENIVTVNDSSYDRTLAFLQSTYIPWRAVHLPTCLGSSVCCGQLRDFSAKCVGEINEHFLVGSQL